MKYVGITKNCRLIGLKNDKVKRITFMEDGSTLEIKRASLTVKDCGDITDKEYDYIRWANNLNYTQWEYIREDKFNNPKVKQILHEIISSKRHQDEAHCGTL